MKSRDFAVRFFLSVPIHKLIVRLSLVFVIFHVKSNLYIDLFARLLAIYMLVGAGMDDSKVGWGILLFIMLFINFDERWVIDNHKYLSTYWVVAVFSSLFLPFNQRGEYLQKNAKLLLGLSFFLATFWKLYAGQYLNGSFFTYKFLTSPRFYPMVSLWSPLTFQELRYNMELVDKMLAWPQLAPVATLINYPIIDKVAFGFSYLVLFMEGSVATVFLLPKRFVNPYIAHATLISFIIGTYSIVSVAGFNYILVLLGICQIKKNQKKLTYVYLVVLIWTELKRLPWEEYFFYLSKIF